MKVRDHRKAQTLFGVSKATIYRVLVTLEHHRYVVQNPVMDRYRLGPRLRQIVQSAGPRLELAAEAYPHMDQLCERTKEVVHLDVLDRCRHPIIRTPRRLGERAAPRACGVPYGFGNGEARRQASGAAQRLKRAQD